MNSMLAWIQHHPTFAMRSDVLSPISSILTHFNARIRLILSSFNDEDGAR